LATRHGAGAAANGSRWLLAARSLRCDIARARRRQTYDGVRDVDGLRCARAVGEPPGELRAVTCASIVGIVPYKGFFSAKRARKRSQQLDVQGSTCSCGRQGAFPRWLLERSPFSRR